MALLRLLANINEDFRMRLEVLHFNHGLRYESEEEAYFVESLARTYNLPFHIRRATKEQINSWQHNENSVQQYAREWRRREAARLLKEQCSLSESSGIYNSPNTRGFVVTAHHADDQTETILLKLLRGVHISSIGGMEVWIRQIQFNHRHLLIIAIVGMTTGVQLAK